MRGTWIQRNTIAHYAASDAKTHRIQIEGDRSLLGLENYIRSRYHIPVWNKIILKRQDGQPFRIENRAHNTLVIQYDPDSDTRPLINVRIDAADRSYLLKDIRVENDTTNFMEYLGQQLWFQLPEPAKCSFSPEHPWANGQQVTIIPSVPLVFGPSAFPYITRRMIQIHLSGEPWESLS
jgi:hypothetical protein